MALQKTSTSIHGFIATDAYHRVEAVRFDSKESISFNVRSYKSIDFPAFADQVFSCNYVASGDSPLAQAYEYIKTLPEFSDAIDC